MKSLLVFSVHTLLRTTIRDITRSLNLFQGFITDSGNVTLSRVQLIMRDLGDMEDEIFKKRQQTELMFRERDKAKKRREKQQKMRHILSGQWAPQVQSQSIALLVGVTIQ